jgi:hypothetical protein
MSLASYSAESRREDAHYIERLKRRVAELESKLDDACAERDRLRGALYPIIVAPSPSE